MKGHFFQIWKFESQGMNYLSSLTILISNKVTFGKSKILPRRVSLLSKESGLVEVGERRK